LHHSEEVGAGTVHLVDECYARHVVLVSLAPYGFTLRLNPSNGTEDRHSAVKYPERPLHLNGEVYVPRSVNEVDLKELIPVFPESGSGCGCYSDPSLLLLHHPVHGGIAVIDFADAVYTAREIENALGSCSLPGINMGHYANVPGMFEIAVHSLLPANHTYRLSEPEMGECLVGFGHTVGILFFLVCAAFIVVGCHHLCCKFLGHAAACALTREENKVLHADAHLAVRTYLEGHLEGGTTNPAAFNLNVWSDIIKSLFPNLQGALLHVFHLLGDNIE